uniref:SFRICE_015897 n=1 Tax=Spodoptera frugiperda TaxID=7108 RepID=A0A2H1VWF9_SPOFR
MSQWDSLTKNAANNSIYCLQIRGDVGYATSPRLRTLLMIKSPSMVFHYKRKTNRAAWSEDTLVRAVKAVKDDGQSINSTAKKFGIPFTTLQRHVKSGNKSKKLDFLELVYNYATRNHISHPFKNGKAGDDWFSGFKRRHPEIVLRAPEPTSLARTRGFNRPQVELFYTNFWNLIEKYNFDATTIYNMDETGIKSSTSKPPKVLSIKGKRQVGVICSAERGQLTTVICCCNAAGTFIPPFFIFARKRMQERLLDNAPPGSQATVTDNGWIHGEAFLNWLQFFVEKVRPSETRKVLLLLDNHESHKFYPALEFATKNHIIFLSFAPHTTDRMQPLDVAVYGPLKKYFEQELNTFQKTHPGRIVNQYDMAKLFGGAYAKSASVQNAVNGFKKPGIWPYDPNVFGEEDYAPSTMTDRPFPDTPSAMTEDTVNDAPSTTDCALNDSPATRMTDPVASVTAEAAVAESSTQSVIISEIETERSTTPLPDSNTLKEGSTHSLGEKYPPPSASLTPFQIRPVPTMAAPKTGRKHKRQKSEVLTSTPVKAEQALKFEKANIKKTKISELAGPSKTKNKISSVKQLNKNPNPDFYCLVCAEKYTEPPAEDWIQCNQCKSWAHEDCTSYVGVGSYFCDECED